VRRETLIALAEKLPPCVVGMEACCGAHHVGRVLTAHGHDVRLMSPEYVRPYVKAQRTTIGTPRGSRKRRRGRRCGLSN
jgi:transposase